MDYFSEQIDGKRPIPRPKKISLLFVVSGTFNQSVYGSYNETSTYHSNTELSPGMYILVKTNTQQFTINIKRKKNRA